MDRRHLIASGISLLGAAACASTPRPTQPGYDNYAAASEQGPAPTYTSDELVQAASDFFGVAAESVGAAIQKVFAEQGQPTGYIAGEEASGAFTVGARYGRGLMYMKNRPTTEVYWQGPTIGWDVGGNASRVFTLVYGMNQPELIFQRFPGVEGSAYLVGGMGVNYQRASGITLAPIRSGVGLRLGANIGYLAYSRQRNILPF
jgi:hypothetical protein